jgi:hypothetical protein
VKSCRRRTRATCPDSGAGNGQRAQRTRRRARTARPGVGDSGARRARCGRRDAARHRRVHAALAVIAWSRTASGQGRRSS